MIDTVHVGNITILNAITLLRSPSCAPFQKCSFPRTYLDNFLGEFKLSRERGRVFRYMVIELKVLPGETCLKQSPK